MARCDRTIYQKQISYISSSVTNRTPICSKDIKLIRMREHIAIHILKKQIDLKLSRVPIIQNYHHFWYYDFFSDYFVELNSLILNQLLIFILELI